MTSERLEFILGRANRETEEILNLLVMVGSTRVSSLTLLHQARRVALCSLRTPIRDCRVVTEVSRIYLTNNVKEKRKAVLTFIFFFFFYVYVQYRKRPRTL